MNNRIALIIFCNLFLFACQESTKSIPAVSNKEENVDTTAFKSDRTIFLVDHCDNDNYSATLEEDKLKGNDSCILRINSRDQKINKIKILNVPADKSSINYCEDDYVVVGFACGGPCYSHVFVFTDEGKNKQFAYSQRISNNPNIIAHIRNEEFETLIIHNLKTHKEINVDISDNNAELNYGHMDTLYMKQNKLFIQYPTTENQTKKKSISLDEIMK
ncbi:MAG: hypothetical protein ACFHU9_05840 [Fluviicola sp.]